MDQVRKVSDKCNNIFTAYVNVDILILHVLIYYKHDLIICGLHVTVIIYYLF